MNINFNNEELNKIIEITKKECLTKCVNTIENCNKRCINKSIVNKCKMQKN
jgi:hypothetical protein